MSNSTTRLLWWALVISLLVYVLMAHIAPLPASPTPALISTLLPILTFISLGTAVGTVFYRRHALVRPIRSGELDPTTPAGMQQAFTPFIVNLVLSESVGIYGLVLAFLSGQPLYSVWFAIPALVLMYVHRPTAPDLVPPARDPQVGSRPEPIG